MKICRGDVPWEDCFRDLNHIGYAGPISIEWEDAAMDRLHGAPEALEFRMLVSCVMGNCRLPPAALIESTEGVTYVPSLALMSLRKIWTLHSTAPILPSRAYAKYRQALCMRTLMYCGRRCSFALEEQKRQPATHSEQYRSTNNSTTFMAPQLPIT